jgi:hypothetical protein
MMGLGFLIKNFSLGQRDILMVRNLNNLASETADFVPIVFFQEYGKSLLIPNFCLMQSQELWSFDGYTFATDLMAAQALIKCPLAKKRYFYVWDLEWLYLKQYTYRAMANIYCNDELDLIARSDSHAKILANNWKEPCTVIPDFNYHQLVELIQQNETNESTSRST